jgi:peroxiredoxin
MPASAKSAPRFSGLSTQASAYQREMAERLRLPFALLSDANFALQGALALPTFRTGGVTYLKRLTLALKEAPSNASTIPCIRRPRTPVKSAPGLA